MNPWWKFCVVCFVSLALGCQRSPKPDPVAVAKVVGLKRLDTNESPVGTLTITSKDAFLLQIDVEPLPNPPADCSHPLNWHCFVVFLRKEKSAVDESFSYCLSRNPVKDPQFMPLPFKGAAKHWAKKPSNLQFPQDEVVNDKILSFVTFVASPFETLGEFEYEVRLYPQCKWINSSTFKSGEPVVIKNGIIKVID